MHNYRNEHIVGSIAFAKQIAIDLVTLSFVLATFAFPRLLIEILLHLSFFSFGVGKGIEIMVSGILKDVKRGDLDLRVSNNSFLFEFVKRAKTDSIRSRFPNASPLEHKRRMYEKKHINYSRSQLEYVFKNPDKYLMPDPMNFYGHHFDYMQNDELEWGWYTTETLEDTAPLIEINPEDFFIFLEED